MKILLSLILDKEELLNELCLFLDHIYIQEYNSQWCYQQIMQIIICYFIDKIVII